MHAWFNHQQVKFRVSLGEAFFAVKVRETAQEVFDNCVLSCRIHCIAVDYVDLDELGGLVDLIVDVDFGKAVSVLHPLAAYI